MNQYELAWGGNGNDTQTRLFDHFSDNDAITRMAERIVALDRDSKVWAGWVRLRILPSGDTVLAWTKTSDEKPTSEGEKL